MPCRVHGISVSRSAEQARAIVSGLVQEIFALEGRQRETMAALDIDDPRLVPDTASSTQR